jgi:wobble nucleotide-excising tRNase
MTVERIQLLRNIGQFDSVNAGAQIPLNKLSLIYAENGRGKTTLAAIFRSLSTGEPRLINERQRLGAQHTPHIVLTIAGAPVVFQNGAWPAADSRVAIFDDAFVAANVCSGIEIEASHRQNLHELILGAQGVGLNSALIRHVYQVEIHNRDLKIKGDAIPAAVRGSMAIDDFCALANDPSIDLKIQAAERALAAAQSADAIVQRQVFVPLSLPAFDQDAIKLVLGRTLASLEAGAAARLREHMASLGKGGEAWAGEGMTRVAAASEGKDGEICPFCAQSLAGSSLIDHYQAYFSQAYTDLKEEISQTGRGIAASHGGDVPAAFERSVRVAVENREFWRNFMDVPEINVDTAVIARAWGVARDSVLSALRAKAAAPLEAMTLPVEAIRAIAAYDALRISVATLSAELETRNAGIARVKEQASGANVASLLADLSQLTAVKRRHEPANAALCQDFLAEKAAKAGTEGLRDQARAALDQYRQNVFPAYELAINHYLGRFNAGFRIGSVTSVNNRGGSSASYAVLINNISVALTAGAGPAFRNTLSAGDRNTLALAFFFASLEQDPLLGQKIVILDDPMTSLDEHRSLTTVHEMLSLHRRVGQMIVLSHSKPFLCAVWSDADPMTRSAMRIVRDGAGSSLAMWDVRQDSITEHDRRHRMVSEYLQAGNPANERAVAAALRPILEAFMRVAYPATFPPETLLGPFIGTCQQRLGTPDEILSAADIITLRGLLDYANRFHHDTNPAWETAAINDQELVDFARRTLEFACRG